MRIGLILLVFAFIGVGFFFVGYLAYTEGLSGATLTFLGFWVIVSMLLGPWVLDEETHIRMRQLRQSRKFNL